MTERSPRSSAFSWVVPAVIGALAGSLVTLILTDMREPSEQAAPAAASSPAASAAPTAVENPPAADLSAAERRDPADVLAIGAVDAPVVLVAFSDYQCPYCARWSVDTLPTMLEYVDQGVLRIEWRDLNIFGADSERAAIATYAAGKQGKFLEFHEALFEGGEIRAAGDLTQEALVALAGDLGLDTAQFAADMADPETLSAIAANAQLGVDLGAYSTPAFIVGGQPVVGAQPTSIFVDAVEQALAGA